jgi:hypothetical protein
MVTRLVLAMLVALPSLAAQIQAPLANGSGWGDIGDTHVGKITGSVHSMAEDNTTYWLIKDSNGDPILRIAKDPREKSVSNAEAAILSAGGTVTIDLTGQEVVSVSN